MKKNIEILPPHLNTREESRLIHPLKVFLSRKCEPVNPVFQSSLLQKLAGPSILVSDPDEGSLQKTKS